MKQNKQHQQSRVWRVVWTVRLRKLVFTNYGLRPRLSDEKLPGLVTGYLSLLPSSAPSPRIN